MDKMFGVPAMIGLVTEQIEILPVKGGEEVEVQIDNLSAIIPIFACGSGSLGSARFILVNDNWRMSLLNAKLENEGL